MEVVEPNQLQPVSTNQRLMKASLARGRDILAREIPDEPISSGKSCFSTDNGVQV